MELLGAMNAEGIDARWVQTIDGRKRLGWDEGLGAAFLLTVKRAGGRARDKLSSGRKGGEGLRNRL